MAEVESRVTTIFGLMLNGASRKEIIQYSTEKWDITDRQTDSYIKRARELYEEEMQSTREQHIGLAYARLNGLYMKTTKVQDYRSALAVQREINILLGLHAPTKQEVTGANGSELVIKVVYDE